MVLECESSLSDVQDVHHRRRRRARVADDDALRDGGDDARERPATGVLYRASVRDAVCGVDRAPGAKSFREKVLVRGRVGQCRDYNAI